MIMFLSTTQAHALYCTLNRENPKNKGQYDQPLLYATEVLKNGIKQQLVLIKVSGEVVENFDFSLLTLPQDLISIDKAIFAVVTRNEDNTLTIGIGGVDTSKTDNITPMYSMAAGNQGKYMTIIDFTHKLALACSQP